MNHAYDRKPTRVFLKNMVETQKVVAILISLIASIISGIHLNITLLNSHTEYIVPI